MGNLLVILQQQESDDSDNRSVSGNSEETLQYYQSPIQHSLDNSLNSGDTSNTNLNHQNFYQNHQVGYRNHDMFEQDADDSESENMPLLAHAIPILSSFSILNSRTEEGFPDDPPPYYTEDGSLEQLPSYHQIQGMFFTFLLHLTM